MMSVKPNLFALPPGVDFAAELIAGLRARFGHGPADLARVQLWVNTSRMRRRLWDLFDQGDPCLLPDIRLIGDLGGLYSAHTIMPVSDLERRLQLRQLVIRLIDLQKGVFPRSAAFDLADSLARLFVEMADEAVTAADLAGLDVSDLSGHWRNALAFFDIAAGLDIAPDRATLGRLAVEILVAEWAQSPPDHPIVVAGSTGSRGPAQILMAAVSGLKQGAVVLPGFDFGMGADVWDALLDHPGGDDHPQNRFLMLAETLGMSVAEIQPWTRAKPASAARNRLLSLALRPAPVTDGWLRDGPDLGDVGPSCAGVDLVEAPDARSEALTIALRLRRAALDGQTAALITPDRTLARRVTAALDRWRIRPDDSAGVALAETAAGRLALLVARGLGRTLLSDELIALLSHPLVGAGPDRGAHLDMTRGLELWLRAKALGKPRAADLEIWAGDDADRIAWQGRISPIIAALDTVSAGPLSDLLGRVRDIAQRLAGDALWDAEPGEKLAEAFDALARAAPSAGEFALAEFADLMTSVLGRAEVREAMIAHPRVMIWGTLEARVQTVDLAILGGLNEGVWPSGTDPDPWLSRQMRRDAGLLLPERQVGLAAHDFQQAVAASQVMLTRCLRDDDALTVPSRWINRLTNLLGGLADQGGPAALKAMRARGTRWTDLARSVEHNFTPTPPAPRPAPMPPIHARPTRLSVTQIKTLIRDPYAIYARHVLRLRPLNPRRAEPNALGRGTAVHAALEDFVRQSVDNADLLTEEALLTQIDRAFLPFTDWPAIRRLWRAVYARNASRFIAQETLRQSTARPTWFETPGQVSLPLQGCDITFRLTAAVDRIDMRPDGSYAIFDYKTGQLPSAKQIGIFDRQLYLLAMIAELGGFENTPASTVSEAAFLGVGTNLDHRAADTQKTTAADTRSQLIQLLSDFAQPDKGFTARAAADLERTSGDFDHLARYGEWDDSAPAAPERVGA